MTMTSRGPTAHSAVSSSPPWAGRAAEVSPVLRLAPAQYPLNGSALTFGCPRGGFALVELLIAMALGTSLLAGLGVTAAELSRTARSLAEHADRLERTDFALAHLAQSVWTAWPMRYEAPLGSPCESPDPQATTGLRIVAAGDYDCLPRWHVVSGMPMLIIEGLEWCRRPDCGDEPPFGWRLETPGCSPLFQPATALLVYHYSPPSQGGCTARAEQTVWSRQLYYLRDYAWTPGDGIGALMRKRWRAPGRGFGRGEMLIPGIGAWFVEPVFPTATGDATAAIGVDLTLVGGAVQSGLAGIAAKLSTNAGWAGNDGSVGGQTSATTMLTSRIVSRWYQSGHIVDE